jgi:hypothetical protein
MFSKVRMPVQRVEKTHRKDARCMTDQRRFGAGAFLAWTGACADL